MASMNTMRRPLSSWRDRCLRELGVLPLHLQQAPAMISHAALSEQRVGTEKSWVFKQPATVPDVALASPQPPQQKIPLLIILPVGAASQPHQQTLLRNALLALPAEMQRAPWLEPSAAEAQIGAAQAYLVLGQEAAAVLERTLPRRVSDSCLIAHADAPGDILAEPARKRGLWLAVKMLLRGRSV